MDHDHAEKGKAGTGASTPPLPQTPAFNSSDVGLTPNGAAGDERVNTGAQKTPVYLSGDGVVDIKSDIAKILKDVKLPERRDFRATGETPKPVEVPDTIPTKLGATVPPAAPVERPTGPLPAQGQKTDSIVVPLHTLKDDLQHVVEDRKISVVRAAALEVEKRAKRRDEGPVVKRARNSSALPTMLFGVAVAVIIGAGGYYAATATSSGREQPVVTSSILFAEQTYTFPLDTAAAGRIIKTQISDASKGAQLTLGSIVQIIPTLPQHDPQGASTVRPATAPEFLQAIHSNAPQELTQALDDQFFFGFQALNGNVPILVLKIRSYDHAFAGMVQWEKTLSEDLSPIFQEIRMTATAADGSITQRKYIDQVVRNYDVRELLNDDGSVGLYYVFPSRTILIIAENPNSFIEILSRLRAQGQL